MEMGKYDLFSIINNCQCLSEETARYFFKQLLIAILHCHKKRFAHCDLKLENIVLDEYGTLKLIDFGLSQKIKINGYGKYNKFYGTSGYMAPEISNSTLFNIK